MKNRLPWAPPARRKAGAPLSVVLNSHVGWRAIMSTRVWLPSLILFGFALAAAAHAASTRNAADIVYSARYYKPGTRPSHYKIWRVNSVGSRRVQLTSGKTDDHSPIWLPDGKTILFVRETSETRKQLCTVGEWGGPVNALITLPQGFTHIDSVAPDRRSVIYLVNELVYPESCYEWKLVLFDLATRQERPLGPGYESAWSPDGRRIYYVPTEGRSRAPAQILDLATGGRVSLEGGLRAAAWLTENRLVAEAFTQESGRGQLVILHADGTKEREVPLRFTWDNDFADSLFAIPGDPDAILYGLHEGNSTYGSSQLFYRISLKDGQATQVANGRDLVWSPNYKSFATGDGRDLAPLDRRRNVWVSPLSVVSLADGKSRHLVQGLVSVGAFDWRLPPERD